MIMMYYVMDEMNNLKVHNYNEPKENSGEEFIYLILFLLEKKLKLVRRFVFHQKI